MLSTVAPLRLDWQLEHVKAYKQRQRTDQYDQSPVQYKLHRWAFIGFVETSQAHIIGVVWTTQTDWPLVCRSGLANGPILVVQDSTALAVSVAQLDI